ncbi:hypothetical protein ACWEK5_44795 [Rhodococcus koreensis]
MPASDRLPEGAFAAGLHRLRGGGPAQHGFGNSFSGAQTAERPRSCGRLGAFGLSWIYQPSENRSTSRKHGRDSIEQGGVAAAAGRSPCTGPPGLERASELFAFEGTEFGVEVVEHRHQTEELTAPCRR